MNQLLFRKRVREIFELLEPTMFNLYERWQDEKEYEDIRDYQGVLQEKLGELCVIKKMTRRPFGFDSTLADGVKVRIFVKVRGTSLSLFAKPLKVKS